MFMESSMNLFAIFAFWSTASVMASPDFTMTVPLSATMSRDAFLPSRKRR
jgi:hypothetical protein